MDVNVDVHQVLDLSTVISRLLHKLKLLCRETFAAWYYATTFLLNGPFCLLLFIFLLYVPVLNVIAITYALWYLYDFGVQTRGGRLNPSVRKWACWRWLRDYFPVKLVKTADLPADRHYIFGYHPHGIMSVGAFCNFATDATGFRELFPGLTSRLVTLTMHFLFPFHRENTLAMGNISAARESIAYLLNEEGVRNAVVIVIGGGKEALDARPNAATILLKDRKGFVAMALRTGSSLVPVYSFGENDVYNQVANERGSKLRAFQEWLIAATRLHVSPPLFYGRGIFPFLTYIPYRRPITTVVGKPIHLEKNPQPSQELINQVHSQYMQDLTTLFNENKAAYGAADQTLTIV